MRAAEIDLLRKRLNEIEAISDQQWIGTLCARKKMELDFHDRDRDQQRIQSMDQKTYEKYYGNRRYYRGTGLSREYVARWITDNARDRVFLDYACGNGLYAINAAKAGALLSLGLDLSPISIENAKQEAVRQDVSEKTVFIIADAENTHLPDNSIDVIICSGMLHHLDLSYAFPEMRRILKPGGKILAVEALNYNPIIRLYRMLTPQMRTDWEKKHILSLADVKFARRFFCIGEIKYWHITSILSPYMMSALPLFNHIDILLTKIPLIRLMAWTFTFELIKENLSKSANND
jgi:ubiquinone/menaquinone biosynthesis C-methylase UbiE